MTKTIEDGLQDAMSSALSAATDLPEDVRRTLGLSGDGDEQPKPKARRSRPPVVSREVADDDEPAPKRVPNKADARLGTAGRCRVDVEALRRDSTHQLGHVIDEAIAFRLKRAVFEQKLTRGPWRTERAVIESALLGWLDRYESGDLEDAA